jgi:hypothetical protein
MILIGCPPGPASGSYNEAHEYHQHKPHFTFFAALFLNAFFFAFALLTSALFAAAFRAISDLRSSSIKANPFGTFFFPPSLPSVTAAAFFLAMKESVP